MTEEQTETKMPPSLVSPYANVSEEHARRLNATIDTADWNLLRAVCPLHGTFNTIIGTFIKHIANELRHRNITTYDPDGLLAIIHECTDRSSSGRGSTPDDTRPAPSVPPTDQVNAVQSADSGRTATKRGRRTGGGGQQ